MCQCPSTKWGCRTQNRHLVETTWTFLLHDNVPSHYPPHYWPFDVVLTTCYLVNHMPSIVLNDQILHSVLFPHTPLHPIFPHVFGSTCFVHNLSPGLDKLSAWSIKCVFLGYNRSQKEYRYFSPTLNYYFIPADVSFFELAPVCFYFQWYWAIYPSWTYFYCSSPLCVTRTLIWASSSELTIWESSSLLTIWGISQA